MSDRPSRLPLRGKRIVVTRARAQASGLVTSLRELGAEVIELPTIETVPLGSYEELDRALQNIADYQWLIVTSSNTVRVLSERMAILGIDPSTLTGLRKAAVGEATARAMSEQGFGADVVPEKYVAESLLDSLGDRVRGSRILLARASIARDVIPNELARAEAIVDVIDAYRTALPSGAAGLLREAFSDLARLPDVVTFTSSSTVKNFLELWREAGFIEVPKEVAAVSIGPITSATLRELSWKPSIEAERHDVEGIVAAVCALLGG